MNAGDPVRVLIGCRAERAGQLAQAFAERHIAPMLAFAPEQLLMFVDDRHHDVLVIEDALARSLDGRAEAIAIDGTALLVLGMTAPTSVTEHAHDIAPSNLSAAEVVARAESLARFARRTREARTLTWGPLHIDMARRSATWNGEPLHLTRIELRLLRTLVDARGAVVDRNDLQRAVWPGSVPDDGARLAAHVRRIRSKIEADPSRPQFLLTARGEGFRLADADETETPRRRATDYAAG